jgi:holo-[acyl-carrier protein] synthase
LTLDAPEKLIQAAAKQLLPEVVGIGIDLVDVDLMRTLIRDGGACFVNAYWSQAEQDATDNQIHRLAGRWAAKEAIMKSLGHGVGDVDPIDVEIAALPSGAPQVVLHRGAAQLAEELRVRRCHVSITHESSWAAAIALAVRG